MQSLEEITRRLKARRPKKKLKPMADDIRVPTRLTNKFCPKHPKTRLVYNSKTKPFCPKCEAEKIAKEKIEHERRAQVQDARDYLTHNSLTDSPGQFHCTFSNFKAAKGSKEAYVGNMAYKLAHEYIDNPGKLITTLMYGTPGEGKSHLAMAMLNEINQKSNPPQNCLFIDVGELFNNWQHSFNDPYSKWSDKGIIDLLSSPVNKKKYIGGTDVLVLDDLGSESSMRSQASEATDRKQGIIKSILDRQQRIIITTNLTFEQLKQVYNPKIISRLLWHSQGRRIDFTGIKDKRGF